MKNRKYGSTKNLSLIELKNKIDSLPYIKTAFLFGSRVSGETHAKSDYDFAFEMEKLQNENWGMQAKAWVDICDILDLKEYDVDVVDLSSADSYLKQTILQNHILLKGDKNDISRLLN